MDEGAFLWRGRRVLVTGCTGFLGGAVVAELLGRGAEVVGLVRDREAGDLFVRHGLSGRVRVVYGRADDLFRIHSALAVHEAGAVFHLAVTGTTARDRGLEVVVEAIRRYDPRIPVVTTRPWDVPPPPPSAVALGTARFGGLFGPGDPDPSHMIPASVSTLTAGGWSQTAAEQLAHDFVHVRDAARACVMLAEAIGSGLPPEARDATFRSGWVLTGRDLAGVVRDVLDDRAPRYRVAESPPNPLGWAPALNFADAIADTIHRIRTTAQTRLSGPHTSDPPRRAAA